MDWMDGRFRWALWRRTAFFAGKTRYHRKSATGLDAGTPVDYILYNALGMPLA